MSGQCRDEHRGCRILGFRIPLELQEHLHDCTPNDLLAAYAALALRPLATPCIR
jgi:hypothetical protein